MISKRTIAIAVIVGCLFLVFAGRYSPLLAPATIGWVITAFAGSSKHSRQAQVICGVIAACLLFLQVQILVVILITCEQAGDTTLRNSSALALIAMFVIYVASLIGHFGRILRTRSIKSLWTFAMSTFLAIIQVIVIGKKKKGSVLSKDTIPLSLLKQRQTGTNVCQYSGLTGILVQD